MYRKWYITYNLLKSFLAAMNTQLHGIFWNYLHLFTLCKKFRDLWRKDKRAVVIPPEELGNGFGRFGGSILLKEMTCFREHLQLKFSCKAHV
jgi:hypothetical protein